MHYTDARPGPLLVALGGMHGNERAGVVALQRLAMMLAAEPAKNPSFAYRGTFVGLAGNRAAIARGNRFVRQDLNRIWTPANVARIAALPAAARGPEETELYELHSTIRNLVAHIRPPQLYVLDLHTTTADGGIFTLPARAPESERLAAELHAPVITGMLDGLAGTTLHYFTDANWPVPTSAVTFEAGQHDDPQSADRAVAAVVNFMRAAGAIRQQDVEHRHDVLLQAYSAGLPRRSHLVYTHRIQPGDQFVMRPGYVNFQAVKKDEVLAHDRHGIIRAPRSGRLLMPLYQQQGDDGFFIVEPRED